MPIVNGKYESPIWENNQPPAMDAAEMQAITDSVEESIHALGDYTTPAQKMGLTGDLSVGASLGVLANIGNVHVWRKTVVTEEEIPAGYTLGPVQNSNIDIFGGYSNYNVTERGVWRYSKTISVDANGTISLDNYSLLDVESTWSGNNNDAYVAKQCLSGSFAICIDAPTGWDSENIHPLYPPIVGKVYFFPDDIEVLDIERPDTSGYLEVAANKYQEVTSNPYVPAGTHITYLTSTNRNAYQEGDDAKEAGYVLGDMVSGYLFASAWTGNASNYYYSETIKVSDTGTLTQENVKSYTANATNDSWVSNIQSAIRGKFITVSGEKDNGGSEGTNLVYIPDDAIVSYFENGVSLGYPYNYGFLVNKMQQVTGYPAIPAGTTIEYLGVLGDPGKQIVFGEFIGDNTAGREIKLGFKPSMVVLIPHSYINLRIDLGTTDTPFWCMVPGCDYETSAYPLSEEYMYITEKGFIVSYDSDASEIYWNQQYKSYYYLALE